MNILQSFQQYTNTVNFSKMSTDINMAPVLARPTVENNIQDKTNKLAIVCGKTVCGEIKQGESNVQKTH